MAVGNIGGIGPGQVPADVRALAAEIALTNAKLLAGALMPGEILTARVGATLGDGKVSLTVRGQTLIANSATTLLPDSLIKLVVQSGGDQPVLRILTNSAADQQVSTSTPSSRAAALGLPATAIATAALAAFEQAGAPLDPVRLKEAVAQLQTLPPAQIPQRAQAFALLAQAGLPATPPFIALAERSATGALPNPAAAVAELQRVAQATVAAPAGQTSAVPASAVSNQQPAPSSQLPVTTAQPSAPVAQQTVPVTGQPLASAGQLPSVPQLPGGGIGAPIVGDPDTPPTTTAPAATTAPPSPAAAPVVSVPTPAAPVSVVLPLVPTPSPTAASTLPRPLAPGSPVPASAAPASTFTVPAIPVATTVAGTVVPDLARGGATAVLQALALVGVRPRETGEMLLPKSEPTLLHRLDVPVEEIDPIRAMDSGTRHAPQSPLDAAVVHVMREQAAETVVKPQALVDYDIVLGLPLQVMGQPLPARLAVAERQTSAGTATFLRVDAELTHLGPLSVRISGIENGPMAITVLATGPALGALADALPDLNESLRALGLTAGVRIADLIEDLSHG